MHRSESVPSGMGGGNASAASEKPLSPAAEAERSIIKKYRKALWCPFIKAVKQYALVKEGDGIAVCISGGKDSFLLAKCMQELQRHGEVPFTLAYIVMDPGYAPQNRRLIEENAERLGVPVQIFKSDIFAVVDGVAGGSPCYLCARMRRGYLYEFAKQCGCNKIALGHHFDDVVSTTLLSMFYGAEIRTMLPKLRSTSHVGMELIRPLYAVRERDISAWAAHHGLTFLNCACRFTERSAEKEGESKRQEMKALLASLGQANPAAAENVFRSTQNVALDCIVGWRKDGRRGSFLDEYD